jgi:hypothetical protein
MNIFMSKIEKDSKTKNKIPKEKRISSKMTHKTHLTLYSNAPKRQRREQNLDDIDTPRRDHVRKPKREKPLEKTES